MCFEWVFECIFSTSFMIFEIAFTFQFSSHVLPLFATGGANRPVLKNRYKH